MTVLVISLLRLGDLILQRPLIEGLRRKHSGSEIHLLVNRQFSGCEFLFAGLVDRFHYFDREGLQKSSGEKEYNIFWGVKSLQGLVQGINNQCGAKPYEHVYNFTHNRLSAHIAGLIPSANYHGLYAIAGQFFGLSNPWIRFFNSYFGRPEATGFHYTELLSLALEIPSRDAAVTYPSFRDTSRVNKLILIQPLTSDTKKNWRLENYQKLAEALTAATASEVYVLGAPFERKRLEQVIEPRFLRICELEEAAKLVQSAAVLITGDTSIKHLAALHETPILELSLGSSQPLQVGAYTNNSIILQPRVSCGPCPHSQPCEKSRHVCSDELSIEAVLSASLSIVGVTALDWMKFAYDHGELRVFKTSIRPVTGWSVECLSIADKSKFDEVSQQKTMIVEELSRRYEANKGVSHEQRPGNISERSPEAS
jgi:ADP-heptose:LPS heptosyltransferase